MSNNLQIEIDSKIKDITDGLPENNYSINYLIGLICKSEKYSLAEVLMAVVIALDENFLADLLREIYKRETEEFAQTSLDIALDILRSQNMESKILDNHFQF